MANVLVTGVNGFVGRHLVRELIANGDRVVGASRDLEADPSIASLLADYVACDMTNEAEVANLPLDKIDSIINLAGLAAIGKSFDEPDLYMKVNVGVLTSLTGRLARLGRKDMRIVAISTGAVYASDQPLPLTEDSKTSKESSPYAASKIAMEATAIAFKEKGFDCVVARPFNHIGPGQELGFLLPDLYAKISQAQDNEIRVGNLESKRDYTDVRDVARAYIALATADKLEFDTYNVCSGNPVAGTDVLRMLKSAMGSPELKVVVDDLLFRPSDQPILYGDNGRLQAETGWHPTTPLEQTIEDFVKSAGN